MISILKSPYDLSWANSKGSLGIGEAVSSTLLLLAGVASSSPLGTRPFLIPFVHVLKIDSKCYNVSDPSLSDT